MKKSIFFICMLGMFITLPFFAAEPPNKPAQKADSTMLIVFEKDTFLIPAGDTIQFVHGKGSKFDSVVVLFEKDSIKLPLKDTLRIPYSKTPPPDTFAFRYKRKTVKYPMQDTIRIRFDKRLDKPAVLITVKDTIHANADDLIRISKHAKIKLIPAKLPGKLVFSGKIFSDFVGLNIEQPNGLLQTNGYFCYTFPHKDRVFNLLKNWVLADITFSKIEDRNKKLPLRYDSPGTGTPVTGYFNRLDLYQYAHLRTVSKVNLFSIHCKNTLDIYADFIASFYSTAIEDTMKITSASSVTSIACGYNFKMITVKDEDSKYWAAISYSHLFPKLYFNTFQENATDQYNSYRGVITTNHLEDSPNSKIYFPGIGILDLIMAYDGAKSTKYLRVSVSSNNLIGKKTPKNIFFQMQLGITADIEAFLKLGDNKESSANASSDKKDKTRKERTKK
jgi:hypothetical protein